MPNILHKHKMEADGYFDLGKTHKPFLATKASELIPKGGNLWKTYQPKNVVIDTQSVKSIFYL